MKFIILLQLIFFSFSVFALEIDEKLTVRVLKVSESKKTVLLNRGIEDGLVEGDHAKFFLTSGVVARGVVRKTSPTRSIWSLYRVVNSDLIEAEKVMSLKIASAVKITDDSSRAITKSENSDVKVLHGTDIPLADGAEDMGGELSLDEKSELSTVDNRGTINNKSVPIVLGGRLSKTWESFLILSFEAFSVAVDTGSATSSTSLTTISSTLGIEKYLSGNGGFLDQSSAFAILNYGTYSNGGFEGSTVTATVFELGMGGNWHFLAPSTSFNRLIGFVSLGGGLGKVSDVAETSSTTSVTRSGSSNFFFMGIGGKYNIQNGFGARALLEFVRRGESYAIDGGGTYTKVLTGPRIRLGLSYWF